ncbi:MULTISPECIES: hypothetical protein [unclassified Microcoleus]|uniref:hypothetical protein n=1 Tax=unclassified Microcoleus TaxID=2642155 RepID=UPI002FD29F41
MKVNSSLFYKAVLVANLLLASVTGVSVGVQAETKNHPENYRSKYSFYGQNQRQAQTIGCSVKQNPNKITIVSSKNTLIVWVDMCDFSPIL